jgi:predicted amidohydrolase YtcJ
MTGAIPEYVESLAIKDGKVLAVGKYASVMALAGDKTKKIDLIGKTLLPGFIDAHGHMVYFGKNLIDAQLTDVKTIPELIARLKAHAADVPQGAWIVGFGYQAKSLAEKRPPTAEELDQISAVRPVLIVDSSGHLGAINSQLIKSLGLSASTKNPEGGVYVRKPNSRQLLGPVEETALNAVRFHRPAFTGELADKVISGGAALWAKYGHTTAMDCGVGMGNDDIEIIRNAIDKHLLPIDLVVFAKESATDDVLNAAYSVSTQYKSKPEGTAATLLANTSDLDKRYINRVRLGGVKFWLDGSVDTAWMSQPYTTTPPGKKQPYKGYQQIPDQQLEAFLDKYWTSSLQINAHMNGDAAAEQALVAIEKAVKKHGMSDHRPVFVHATYMRPDQIKRMRAVGAIPSFLLSSLYPAGDAVYTLWGPERAAQSVATQSVVKDGMHFTLSHDAPVAPQPNVIGLIWAAVNRITKSGRVIGPDERLSPYDALRGVTSEAAYQIKEEKTKGTLETGKLADLVVLDKNPLKVAPTTIKDIQVLETIKEGRSIFIHHSQKTAQTSLESIEPTEERFVSHAHGEDVVTKNPAISIINETIALLKAAAIR